MSTAKNILGMRFGRLRVIGRLPSRKERSGAIRAMWKCRCRCGKVVTASGAHLREGSIRSCGCLVVDVMTRRSTKHGEFKDGKWSPEYRSWCGLKKRCLNKFDKEYPRYGGRGIRVFRGWIKSFKAFLRHVGRRPSPLHSLDRIDNSVGYIPGNLRWATRSQQQRNTRRNVNLTIGRRTMCLKAWSDISGISPETISLRIRRGWSPEKAVFARSTPRHLRRAVTP